MNKVDLVKRWFELALSDLRSAKFLKNMWPKPLEVICFHCQQSVEKALKGFLAYQDSEPPLAHELHPLAILELKQQ